MKYVYMVERDGICMNDIFVECSKASEYVVRKLLNVTDGKARAHIDNICDMVERFGVWGHVTGSLTIRKVKLK